LLLVDNTKEIARALQSLAMLLGQSFFISFPGGQPSLLIINKKQEEEEEEEEKTAVDLFPYQIHGAIFHQRNSLHGSSGGDGRSVKTNFSFVPTFIVMENLNVGWKKYNNESRNTE